MNFQHSMMLRAGVLISAAFVAAGTAGAATTMDRTGAHLHTVEALRAVLAAKPDVVSAMSENRLPQLIELETQIDKNVKEARRQMNAAFISGAWKSREIKRQGADVIGRIEAVQQLNFISLAFLTGYPSFTKKTPASVADATNRMFMQVDSLLATLDALNRKVDEGGPRAE
jgi:hypothetical protein